MVVLMGWWPVTAALVATTGWWECVSSQFSERSWGHSVLSASYVFVRWLLHQSCVAWRSYTTCLGPREPEVSSSLTSSHFSCGCLPGAACGPPPPPSPQVPFLFSGTSTEGKGPEDDLSTQVCAACLPHSTLSECRATHHGATQESPFP